VTSDPDGLSPVDRRVADRIADLPLVEPEPGWEGRAVQRARDAGLFDPERCTEACEAAPICTVCHLRKPPRGRSVPLEMALVMCRGECAGRDLEPHAGHIFPGERQP
jgi:hypothetical protein